MNTSSTREQLGIGPQNGPLRTANGVAMMAEMLRTENDLVNHPRHNTNENLMADLIRNETLTRENGDATSTYECELSRDDITVKDFYEAIENSVKGFGQIFNEWWATLRLMTEDAGYTTYGDGRFYKVETRGTQCSIQDFLKKYGDYIVSRCQWIGGYGSGGYYLFTKKVPPPIDIESLLRA